MKKITSIVLALVMALSVFSVMAFAEDSDIIYKVISEEEKTCEVTGAKAGVVDLVIPDDVDRIGTYAFSRFSSIKTVTMPNTVTEIGEGAFMHTWYLERISLSDAVTALPDKLFYENRNLQEIKMPEQLESIGESAFYLCESVKEITIPAKVSKIEVDAFTQCWGLSKAYFENREGWVTVSTGSDEPYTWHPDWFAYPADAASALKDYSYCVWYRS